VRVNISLTLIVFTCTFVLLSQESAAPDSRAWQQGTVQSLQLKHRGLFDPHSAEIDLEIAGNDGVIYKTMLAYGVHKVDMVPGVGIVTEERRRKKTHLNVTVGGTVKFAVSEQHGWLVDNDGVEQKLIVKSAILAKQP
jgi:hypothetical protein